MESGSKGRRKSLIPFLAFLRMASGVGLFRGDYWKSQT